MKTLSIVIFTLFFGLKVSLEAQNALLFDGSNDQINCGTDSALAMDGGELTLEAWINASSWRTQVYEGNIICKEENTSNLGYMLRAGDGGRLNFTIGNGSWYELITSSSVMKTNQWYHVAGTYDGKVIRLYLDGKMIDSLIAGTQLGVSYSTQLTIGNHSNVYSRHWHGKIDEVRIWNYARSQSDIQADMYDEYCDPQKGLELYYKLNQGKPNGNNLAEKTAKDYSGNGITGTLVGFDLKGTSSNWTNGYKFNVGSVIDSFKVNTCDRYSVPSRSYVVSKTGTYYDTLPTYMGCDSVLKIDVIIRNKSYSSQNYWGCDSVLAPSGDLYYYQTGVYTDYLKNAIGCDSVVTATVVIGADSSEMNITQCYSYILPSGTDTITETGIYYDHLTSFRGCDSVVKVNATILKSTSSKMTLSSCNFPVQSPSKKYTYKDYGRYYDTLINKQGCDSIITIDFISNVSYGEISPVECRGFTAPSGKYYWDQSGTYFDTIFNKKFCDSIITVNLTILPKSENIVELAGCKRVPSPLGDRIFQYSGTYTDTLVNSIGCDSVLIWKVNVTRIDDGIEQVEKTLKSLSNTGTYQWLDCKNKYTPVEGATEQTFTPLLNGYYGVEVTVGECKDTSACKVISGVGVGDVVNEKISVYPQPASEKLHIKLLEQHSQLALEIVSLDGRIQFEAEFTNPDLDFEITPRIGPGMYWLVIRSAHGNYTQPIVWTAN